MQAGSFYPKLNSSAFSGNAGGILLPKIEFWHHFGQCRRNSFTENGVPPLFWAMQAEFFYRKWSSATFSGNAGGFLLPKMEFWHFFGQCRRVPFTENGVPPLFRAMQEGSFYRKWSSATFSGNASGFLLPKKLSARQFWAMHSLHLAPTRSLPKNGQKKAETL